MECGWWLKSAVLKATSDREVNLWPQLHAMGLTLPQLFFATRKQRDGCVVDGLISRRPDRWLRQMPVGYLIFRFGAISLVFFSVVGVPLETGQTFSLTEDIYTTRMSIWQQMNRQLFHPFNENPLGRPLHSKFHLAVSNIPAILKWNSRNFTPLRKRLHKQPE